MRLDGLGVGSAACPCFLSLFSPFTETRPLIKLSGIKPDAQLSTRPITIRQKTQNSPLMGTGIQP